MIYELLSELALVFSSAGLRLHLPLHTGVGLPEKELVEFEGSCLVSVEPHRVARRLPQLVPDRAGHQGDGEAVHLLSAHSAGESGFITQLSHVWCGHFKTCDCYVLFSIIVLLINRFLLFKLTNF